MKSTRDFVDPRVAASSFDWDTRRVFVTDYWRVRNGQPEWVCAHTRRYPRS